MSANVSDLVRDAAARDGGKAAFLYGSTTLTWGDVEQRVAAVAAGLSALGAVRGDRIALQLGNTPDFPIVYFGALRAGLVAVPVNTGYTRAELMHCLGDSGASVLVTMRSGAETALSVAGELETLRSVVVADVDKAPAGATTLDALLQTTPGTEQSVGGGEDLAVVIYTSGTSGRPKGAMLTHRALLANLDQCGQIDPPVTTADDVVLLVLPLFHIYGLNAALGAVAKHGATGALSERFDPVETLEQIRRQGVTNVIGAPPMYVAWSMLPDVGDAFSSVRLAVSGAAPLPSDVLHRFLDVTGHHVFEGYGLTETAPVLTTTLMSEVAKPASIGRPVPDIELKLVDEQGRLVEEGDPGEICVRGANTFSGYWPDGEGGPDADGWFATGDVAYVDDDGDLHLVDRRRELILVSGFNVYPREVEDVLVEHPDVEEAAVIGIAHPYTGESVKALVVLRAGARLSAEDVIAYCALSLARFKCPTAVEFVAELPHSATGKVSKGRLRETSLESA
ncbi:MAG: long-chain acyl-CoA synthetase [Actinomycetota bacterium]|nr:long-chain acyl-CoA synthetase [Actinomycetota bacterium]